MQASCPVAFASGCCQLYAKQTSAPGLHDGHAEPCSEEPVDKRFLELAFHPARKSTAALLVQALRQEHAPSTHIYSYVGALDLVTLTFSMLHTDWTN